MTSSALGNDKDIEQLDDIDKAVHAQFVASSGSAADFLWPGAEHNARLGHKKQKQARDARRKDNERRLARLQTSTEVISQPQAQSSSSAAAAFSWADGVRERELRGHEARVTTLSIDGALLASMDTDMVVKIWDLCSAECVQTLQLQPNSSRMQLQGDTLAILGPRSGVQIWDLRTGQLLRNIERAYTASMWWCGPSRLLLVTCSVVPVGGSEAALEFEVVDAKSGSMLASTAVPQDGTTHCKAVDPEAGFFVHGGHKFMHVYTLTTLAHCHKLKLLANGRGGYWPDARCNDLHCAAGTIAADVTSDGSELQLWNAADGTCIQRFAQRRVSAVIGGRFVYLDHSTPVGRRERTQGGMRFKDPTPLRLLDTATGATILDHDVNRRLAWTRPTGNSVAVGECAIASTTCEPRDRGHVRAHGEDRSHCILLYRPAPCGVSNRSFNEHERPWDADQHALAAELRCVGLEHFATNKFLQMLEERGYCSIDDVRRGICVSLPFDPLPIQPPSTKVCDLISFVQWMPDSQQVSIRDSMEHTFLGLTSDEANCLADGTAVSVASASPAELMQERRQRQRGQAEAGNAEVNERMDREAERSRGSRKQLANAAEAGDEHAQQRRGAERKRIEARLPGSSADSRRERRKCVAERAVYGSSAGIRDAAEAQRESERDGERGRQRREARDLALSECVQKLISQRASQCARSARRGAASLRPTCKQ